MKRKGEVDLCLLLFISLPIFILAFTYLATVHDDNVKFKQLELKQKYQLDSLRIIDSIKTRSR